MINHVWSVLCSDSVIDRDSNNLSLFNLVEQLTIFKVPPKGQALPVQLQIVSLWVRENPDNPEQGIVRYSFRSPSEQVTKVLEPQNVDLTQYERFRARLLIQALRIEESGRYHFDVEVNEGSEEDWHKVCSIPLMIILKPQEEHAEEN